MSAGEHSRKPPLSAVERAILRMSPGWAARRAQSRIRVQAMQSAYEAVESGRLRRKARDWGSGNTVTAMAQKPLRDLARQLDRNHDLARGVLNTLVRNIVGPTGIGVEPQPLNADGTVNDDLAAQLSALHAAWRELPEVTGELDWSRSEQLLCRSWLRDGASLWQYLEGDVPRLNHSMVVPFSVELMEIDMLVTDYDDPGRNIIQGIERNDWNRPVAYWVYKSHPGERFAGYLPKRKRVPTDRIGHLKLIDRIGQMHGVSMFASVLTRLDDLKDYEESERIAAKVAASMAAVIKKGAPEDYRGPATDEEGNLLPARDMQMAPGMIFDDLLPGESVESIDAKRPNPNAVPWRDGQLRAVAAGADVGYSSISRNYDGSYSSQRQELVEQYGAYQLLSNAFIDQCSRETYKRFVSMAILSGQIRMPRGASFTQVANAMYVAPQMPWIDPVKEAKAFAALEDRAYISGAEVIRRRGGNPSDTLRAEKAWQQNLRDAGVRNLTTQSASDLAPAGAGNEDED